MPPEDMKMLELNQYQKFDKGLFIIYADLECLIEKIDGGKNNLANASATKVHGHIPSDFLISTILLFKSTQNKHDAWRDKECMKNFY